MEKQEFFEARRIVPWNSSGEYYICMMTSSALCIMVVVVKTAKVKKMAATDAKSHENKDIQGYSKSEHFKKKIVLTEGDVPGAFFKNRDPQIFHNEELRSWLKCRVWVGAEENYLQGL